MQRCRVLYVSPLKALAVDVERNLRSPLAGIRQADQRLEQPELRPFVEESLPMLVGMPEQIKIRAVGGKGL
jgi:hypothetical protein